MTGFVCQFIGLRGLHWSATVAQLGVTVLLTGVRSWVRRDLGEELDTIPLPGISLDYIALHLGDYCLRSTSVRRSHYLLGSAVRNLRWEIVTGRYTKSIGRYDRIPKTLLEGPGPMPLFPLSEDSSSSVYVAKDPDHAHAEIVREFYELVQDAEVMQVSKDPRVKIHLHLEPLLKQHDPLLSIASKLKRVMLRTLHIVDGEASNGSLRISPLAESVSWTHVLATRVMQDDGSTSSKLCALELGFHRAYKRHLRGPWTAPAELHAILCLWYHHLVPQQPNSAHGMNQEGVGRGVHTMEETFVSWEDRKDYMRVLGRLDEFQCRYENSVGEMSKWIGAPLMLCPVPDSNPKWDLPVFLNDAPGPSRPVFGMSRPRLFK
jgi:hypothetical protein